MRQRVMGYVERLQRTTPVRVVNAFGGSQAGHYASALAFAGFLSMFPMILGALAIIGLAIRDPRTEGQIQLLVLQLFPGSAQPELQSALHGVKQSAGWLGILSIAGLVWSASSIFGTMEFALTQIFGTRQRDLVRQKLMGFLMMALLVVAIAILVGANTLAAFLPLPGSVAWIPSFIAGTVVMVSLLVVLYRIVPNRAFALRDVLPGAVLAGILIEVLSLAFPLYARFAGHFNTYGAQFGLFFLLATWFYLLSELLLLGAVYNRFRMGDPDRHGLFASPMRETRKTRRPVEAIKEKQTGSDSAEEPPHSNRTLLQRIAIPAAVVVALAGGVIRRRRRGKAPA